MAIGDKSYTAKYTTGDDGTKTFDFTYSSEFDGAKNTVIDYSLVVKNGESVTGTGTTTVGTLNGMSGKDASVTIDGKERKFIIGKNKEAFKLIEKTGVSNLTYEQFVSIIESCFKMQL